MVGSVPPPSSTRPRRLSHIGAQGEVGDAEAKGEPPVMDRLPEGQDLADRDPLRVLRLGWPCQTLAWCGQARLRVSRSRPVPWGLVHRTVHVGPAGAASGPASWAAPGRTNCELTCRCRRLLVCR
jgi:hypothetical protein